MEQVPEEERFYDNVTIMTQAIHQCIMNLFKAGYQTINPDLVQLAATLMNFYDRHELIQGFIENSHKTCWDNIKARNEIFFVDNASDIFKYLPMDKVNLFKDLFLTKDKDGQSVVDDELKDCIWKLFDAMVKISIKYIAKHKRSRISFYNEIELERHAKIWKIELKI